VAGSNWRGGSRHLTWSKLKKTRFYAVNVFYIQNDAHRAIMIQITIEMVQKNRWELGNAGNLEVVGNYRNPECYNQKTSKWLSRSHVRIHFDI